MRSTATDTAASPGSAYADRVFRSPMGVTGGVLLLAFGIALAGDAVLHGTGRAPWVALSGLLLAAPLVIAFTVYPAVHANEERLRVRNPFRTIVIPWALVEEVRAKYSTEVVASGVTYQLWAVAVSMRGRKRADRRSTRTMEPDGPPGLFGRTRVRQITPQEQPVLATADQAVTDLREMAERHGTATGTTAAITTRWAWPLYAPALAGLIALVLVNVL